MKAIRLLPILLFAAVMFGCGGGGDGFVERQPRTVDFTVAPAQLLTMTNPVGANAIREFRRAANGSLSFVADYPTGGQGSGDNLNGSTNAIFIDRINSRVFAVNAGDNTISALLLNENGTLTRLSTIASGGVRPISITAFGDLVYVLNFGNPGGAVAANISGFRMVGSQLTPIPGSTQALSAANPNPAQIGFTPGGAVLVVSERDTNMLTTFAVNASGIAGAPNAQASVGTTPFGFDFSPNGLMVVTEANAGAANGSSTSTYTVDPAGVITAVSPTVANNQAGNCWVDVSANGRFAYTTNTGSNTVSVYRIENTGGLTLLAGAGGASGAGPVDVGLSNDGQFLYSLNATADSITTFAVAPDGTINAVAAAGLTGLPPNSVGLIVR